MWKRVIGLIFIPSGISASSFSEEFAPWFASVKEGHRIVWLVVVQQEGWWDKLGYNTWDWGLWIFIIHLQFGWIPPWRRGVGWGGVGNWER